MSSSTPPLEKKSANHADNKHKLLDRALTRQQGRRGALIEVLHDVQQIFGFLPRDVLAYIAETLKLPPSHVFGVASFYPSFRLEPPADHMVTVCMGTACYVNGASNLLGEAESLCGCRSGASTRGMPFAVEAAHCLGSCGSGPVVQIDGELRQRVNEEKLAEAVTPLREKNT